MSRLSHAELSKSARFIVRDFYGVSNSLLDPVMEEILLKGCGRLMFFKLEIQSACSLIIP